MSSGAIDASSFSLGGSIWRSLQAGGLPCLPCPCAFGDGDGFPPLLFFTVRFHVRGAHSQPPQLWFLSRSGVLVSPTLNSVGLGFLRWAVNLQVVLAPRLIVQWNSILQESLSGPSQIQCVVGRGGPGVLGFHTSCGSQFPSSYFSLASPFVQEGDIVTCFVSFFFIHYFLYLFTFSSLIFVQVCCRVAFTYEGFCRIGTDVTRLYDLLILYRHSSYGWVHMPFSDTGYRTIDIVWLGPVSLVLSSHCLLMARRL